MTQLTFEAALQSAIVEEMRRDSRVLFLGQDVQWFGLDPDSLVEFGRERILNTPISEAGFIGAATGAALTGMRPVVMLGCSTFLYSAMDQVVNQAAKSRYMFGGQASVPMVIRAPVLYTISAAAHHSDRPWGLFAQAPGLKLIVPATPSDAKGLMKAAIRDGNPVICFEDASLNGTVGDVPDGDYTVPIGMAEVKRTGESVTIVTLGGGVRHALTAADVLENEGISAEVVDIRTVVPLDRNTIIRSVSKTGRLVVIDPAPRTCGVAAEVAATIAEEAFDKLKAPIIRLTAPDLPVAFSPFLEPLLYPTADKVAAAVRKLLGARALKRAVANMP